MVLSPTDHVVIVAAAGGEDEVATRLSRIGFDQVVGYVADPERTMMELPSAVAQASRVIPALLAELLASDDAPWVVDVRNIGELEAGTIPGSAHIPLAELSRRIDEVPTDRPVVAYCQGGWRSSVASSFLRHRGMSDASDLAGGFAAWEVMHEPVAS